MTGIPPGPDRSRSEADVGSPRARSRGSRPLVKGAGYPVVSCRAELHVDELVQALGVWLDAAGLLQFLPCVPVTRVAHLDHADAVRAPDAAGLVDRYPDLFLLISRDVEDHVGMRGAPQVRERLVDGCHVDRIE